MAMTKLKKAARARQAETGERYTDALARVMQDLPMSNEKNVFQLIEMWLKAHGFSTVLRGGTLLFARGTGTLHEIKQDEDQASLILVVLHARTSDAWSFTAELQRTAQETADVVTFAIGARLGLLGTPDVITQSSALKNDLEKALSRAENAEKLLAVYDGTALPPDPWAATLSYKTGDAPLLLPFWSTCRLPRNSSVAHSTNRLFICAQGQSGQGFDRLTISETNVKEGGRTPGGMSVNIRRLQVELFGDPADIEILRQHGVVKAEFTQTHVDLAPLAAIIEPYRSSGAIVLGDKQGNGIRLPGNTTFSVLVVFGAMPDLTSAVDIRITLGCAYDGRETNLIQLG